MQEAGYVVHWPGKVLHVLRHAVVIVQPIYMVHLTVPYDLDVSHTIAARSHHSWLVSPAPLPAQTHRAHL
jgi:hypothetical protein